MRFKTRSSVDLPQPEGPMKDVTLLAYKGMVTSLSERDSP